MREFCEILGLLISVTGIAVEGLGILAMTCYPVRRRRPNPFTLISCGGIAFSSGAVLRSFAQ